MKRSYTYFFIGLLCAVAACTTRPTTNTSGISLPTEPVDVRVGPALLPNSMPYSIVGVWHGVIPCINCPGITYDLMLNEDNTFEETRVYQNRDTGATTLTGTWRITDEGVLELNNRDAAPTQFDLSTAGELRMLDASGNAVETPIADMYRLRRDTTVAVSQGRALNTEQRRVGVDFMATGNEPGWLLEIDLEESVYFKTRPSETVEMRASLPVPVTEGNTTRYKAQTDAGELVVELTKVPCTDAMSGKVLPYTVRITAKGQSYTGCGRYLTGGE